MRKFLIATKNKGKLLEFKNLLSEFPVDIVSYEDFDREIDIDETGKTFEENSQIKALEANKVYGCPVIADDSGLMVDCLGGEPGIYSARYGGEGLSDSERYEELLRRMKGISPEKRSARFVCAVTVAFNKDKYFTVTGKVEGTIALKPSGNKGFGYDPIFYLSKYGKTMAEIDSIEKNRISHRGKALQKMLERLREENEDFSDK